MYALDPLNNCYGHDCLQEAIPTEFAGPLERMLASLSPDSAVLLVRAETPSGFAWLSETRLERMLVRALMGPTQSEIWPLLGNVRAIGLRFTGTSGSTMSALELHTLKRSVWEQIATEWHAESQEDPPFSIVPIAPLFHLDNLEDNIAELNSLLEILINKQLVPQFQPIISLRDGRVFAYEALIRGPKGALLRRPGQMFRVADKARMVAWFDLACLEQCFKQAAENQIRHLLFVNMDAEGLSALEYQERPLALRAREYGLEPSDIVIEITERQMVGDFPRLLEEIARLREQGFHVAIDDAGAGYSSLRTISEIRPDFVKIDRDLVKNCDVCGERKALLQALVQYARTVGTLIIAEGAETREELSTLIELGIPFGQGYIMGKPADTLRGAPKDTREFIADRVHVRETRRSGGKLTAQMLAKPGLAMDAESLLAEAARRFLKEPGLTSIAVVRDGKFEGLVLREQFHHIIHLSKAARATELLPPDTLAQWAQSNVLSVSAASTVSEVARQLLTKQDISLDCDIVVTDAEGAFSGVIAPRLLLETTNSLPIEKARYADPLTNLPGRVLLERELKTRLELQESLAVIRLDVTRLDTVNQQYGLSIGDQLILQVAELARGLTQAARTDIHFIAHLGGDDFVILADAESTQPICRSLLEGFQAIAPCAPPFASGDRARRALAPSNGPLCCLAIAAVTTRNRRFQTVNQVMHALYDVMRNLKSQPTSGFLIDGNGARSS